MYFREKGIAIDCFLEKVTAPISTRYFCCTLITLAVISWLIISWTWFPGIISDDTFAQLLQAESKIHLSNWHPPIIAEIWKFEIWIFHTPYLLNATWIALAATGLYLFLSERPCILSLTIYPVLFFSPWIAGVCAYLYKDFPLGWLLLILCALLIKFQRAHQHSYLLKGIFILTTIFATLLRFNAAFAIAPLCVAWIFGWRFRVLHLITSLGIVFILLLGIPFSNHFFFRAFNDHPETSLELFDLAGISHFSLPKKERKQAFSNWKIIQIPPQKASIVPFQGLRAWKVARTSNWMHSSLTDRLSACYYPNNMASMGGWNPDLYPFRLGGGWDKWSHNWISSMQYPDKRALLCTELGNKLRLDSDNLYQAWKTAIKKHPMAYLHHRWKYFSRVYLQKIRPWQGTLGPALSWGYGGLYGMNGDFTYRHKTLLGKYYTSWHIFHELPTNYSVCWIIISILFFVSTTVGNSQGERLINCFSFSALMYIFEYFFVGVGPGWRFIFPSVTLIIASFLTWYVTGCPLGNKQSRRFALLIISPLIFWRIVL